MQEVDATRENDDGEEAYSSKSFTIDSQDKYIASPTNIGRSKPNSRN